MLNQIFTDTARRFRDDPIAATDELRERLPEFDDSTQLEGLWINLFCSRPDMWDQTRRCVRHGSHRANPFSTALLDGLDAFALDFDTQHGLIAKGASLFLQEQMESAYDCFRAASCSVLQRMYQGANSVQLSDRENTFSEIEWSHGHGRDFTILVAADMKYYREFIHDLFHSLPREIGLHVHILNPTANHGGYIHAPGVGYSFELCPHDLVYFASARFLRARQIQEIYGTPMVITDMDSLFNQNTNIDKLRGLKDLTFRTATWGGCHVPWRTATGSGVFVPETRHEFLIDMENRIRRKFRPGEYPKLWWFDQQMLFDAMQASGCFDVFKFSPFRTNRTKPDVKRKAKRGG